MSLKDSQSNSFVEYAPLIQAYINIYGMASGNDLVHYIMRTKGPVNYENDKFVSAIEYLIKARLLNRVIYTPPHLPTGILYFPAGTDFAVGIQD